MQCRNEFTYKSKTRGFFRQIIKMRRIWNYDKLVWATVRKLEFKRIVWKAVGKEFKIILVCAICVPLPCGVKILKKKNCRIYFCDRWQLKDQTAMQSSLSSIKEKQTISKKKRCAGKLFFMTFILILLVFRSAKHCTQIMFYFVLIDQWPYGFINTPICAIFLILRRASIGTIKNKPSRTGWLQEGNETGYACHRHQSHV